VTTVLILAAALTVYTLFVLASPAASCRSCHGWGTGRKLRRRTTCARCDGTGYRFRPGAVLIHRATAVWQRTRYRGEEPPIPPWRPPRNTPPPGP
jgi:hypothetical protein